MGTAAAPAPAARRPGWSRYVAAIVLVGALTASGVALVQSRDDGATKSIATGSGGEIFREAAAKPGPKPFTPSVADKVIAPKPVSFPTTTAAPQGQTAVLATTGTEPGLYGGTRDSSRCDASQMATYLEQNPDKGAAWAAVEGIKPSEIRSFLLGLTPVLLRVDTRVTNNGFDNGVATPRQAVLQAGTAVLVDATGMPRAKCACGNPLGPPAPAKVTPTYTGDQWPEFTPAQVVVVQPGPTVVQIILVDPRNDEPFSRPVGTSGDADVDAPPGTDASNPLGGSPTSSSSSTTDSRSSSSTGGVSVAGTVSLLPAAAQQLAAQGTEYETTDSSWSLAVAGDGTESGHFSVTFRIREKASCVYQSTLSGDLEGVASGSVLTGTWSGAFAEMVESGDCSGVSLLNQATQGTWDGQLTSDGATGSMQVEGAALLGFEARG